jgi:hypothetical protein
MIRGFTGFTLHGLLLNHANPLIPPHAVHVTPLTRGLIYMLELIAENK